MLLDLLKPLIVNYMIIISFTVSINLFFPFKRNKPTSLREKWIYSIIGSIAAILCMFYPIEVLWDTNFDLRMVIIVALTLYRGFWVGFLTFSFVSVVRYLIGGQFFIPGILINFIAFLAAMLFRQRFIHGHHQFRVLIMIFSVFTTLSILTLEWFVPALDRYFYLIYFSVFLSSLIALIYTIEKLMSINQQIDETVYIENLKTVSHMAAAFAHEIRNPLTTVRGFVQYLSSNNRHEELPQYSQLIIDELDRTNEIISDFLSLTKPGDSVREKVIVEKVIQDTVNLMKPTAQLKNIQMVAQLSKAHQVNVDGKLLKQALLNILKNAIEAIENKQMGSDGRIYITTLSLSNQKVAILIEDNGIGLTEEELKRIGLPYYTTKSKGTGLGTLIMNKLIRDLGGTVHYYSQKNQWTRVEITFPLAPEKDAE
ncbi:ATP-binding protein [Bacillus kexueae]|uniref:ATP-binding protein n=1 Tax=Aeribacillus kexueae TaxID=2078952 RepID=UPI001FAFB998|nr:ATP-binding protein [Bacillus kexueae]